jgi:lipopolysaccharide transport system permease protein
MGQNILALWRARDILFTWTVREVKVRYTDTSLGLAWIVIYPAAWVVLFTLLFSHLVPVPVQGVPYPLFVMSGLVPWFFFSNTTSNAVSSLKNNANLIPKVYFPREILPLGSVLVGLLDLSLYLLLLVATMLFYRVGGGRTLWMLPPIVLCMASLTLAVGLLTSRLALFQREVQLLVPMALQFLPGGDRAPAVSGDLYAESDGVTDGRVPQDSDLQAVARLAHVSVWGGGVRGAAGVCLLGLQTG